LIEGDRAGCEERHYDDRMCSQYPAPARVSHHPILASPIAR
jgi:hypothetical protein